VTGGRSDGIEWRHSSSCNGGTCVEVASLDGRIGVRDSESPANVITFSASSWRDFLAGVENGEFGYEFLTEP